MYSVIKNKFLNNQEAVLVIALFLTSFFGYLAYFPFDRDIIITPYLFFIRLLVSLSSVGLYCWVLYTIGGCFSKYLANVRIEDVNYIIFRFVLGICLLSFSYLVLGIGKSLTYNNVFLITALLFILGFYFSTQYKPTLFKSKLKEHFLLRLALIPFLFFGILLCGLPEIDWDSSVYHIPAIREFMRSGEIGIYPTNEPFNFPMSHNLIYIPLDYFNLDSGIKFFNLFMLLIGIKGIFQASKIYFNRLFSHIATYIFLSCYYLWINAATARVEVPICSYIIIYYLLKLISFKKNSKEILCLGIVLLGMIASSKSTGLIFAFFEIILIIISYAIDNGPVRIKNIKNNLFGFILTGIILVLPISYWYGKNALFFNNFNYPKSAALSTDYKKNPFEFLLLRSNNYFLKTEKNISEISTNTDSFSIALTRIFNKPVEINKYDYSLLGIIKNPEVFSYSQKDLNWLLLLGLIPFSLNKSILYICFPCLATLSIILLKGHLIRYSIPLVGILSFFSAYNLNFSLNKISKTFLKKLFLSIMILTISVISFEQFKRVFFHLKYSKIDLFLNEKFSIENYIYHIAFNRKMKSGPLISKINKLIPASETVLMIGENKSLYITPKHISDQDQLSRQAVPWLRLIDDTNGDYKSILQNLKHQKIKYIAINLSYYDKYYAQAKFYENNNVRLRTIDRCHSNLLRQTLSHLSVFLQKHAKKIYSSYQKNIYIFKIN